MENSCFIRCLHEPGAALVESIEDGIITHYPAGFQQATELTA